MASPVTAVAEAEMGFVGVTYWDNDLSSVQAPIFVTSQSLSRPVVSKSKYTAQLQWVLEGVW